MNKTKLLKSILIPTLGISAIGSIAAISTSCGEKKPTIIHVTDVTLDKTSTTLDISSTEQLTATVLPEDATDKSVTWASDNKSVATVDNNGKIIAVAEGTATIVVTTHDGGKAATCKVTVNDKVIPVTSVSLNKTSTTLDIGSTEQLTATVSPEDATDKSVTWTSDNKSVATVDNNGKITAVAKGTATITAVSVDNPNAKATCSVTVNETVIHVTGVTLDETSVSLDVGATKTLTATVLPEDATDKLVTWTSDNESVATVDNNGKITAVAQGTATITVKTNDGGKTATCAVTVNDFIYIHIESGNNGSVSKTDVAVDKGTTFGEIKSQISVYPDPGYQPGIWSVYENGDYKCDCPDDYKFNDNTNIKILFDSINPQTITKQEGQWGDIKVKYKLLSNHECKLLTKYNGVDDEYGYVSGQGILQVQDHINYNGEPYFVKEIASDWSDGENDITGLWFDNVKHLETICDRAFYHTCALDYYTYGNDWYDSYCSFPEGLKTIGDEAFCGTSYSKEDYITGYSFPSTLESIGEMAFEYSPYIGRNEGDLLVWGSLIFRSLVTIGEDAFWNIDSHRIRYLYSTSWELAQQMKDILEATGDFLIESTRKL